MLNLPESFNQLLSLEECAQIDQTLLPTRDRFSIRITVYSWRYLQQISLGLGLPMAELQLHHIQTWLQQDSILQSQELSDDTFRALFERLLVSSLEPLKKIAQYEETEIENLTLPQILSWFEAQVKSSL